MRTRSRTLVPRGFAVLVASLALVAAGCGHRSGDAGTAEPSTSSLADGSPSVSIKPGVDPTGDTQDATITVDGHQRTYHLYVPTSLPADEPVPLLIGLHGGTGDGEQFARNTQFDRLAEANGFLVVYPDGTGVGPTDAMRTWNGGNCCGTAARDDVDDVAFISALIDEISTTHQVDPARVFATGHSNGAILSYRLACELSDKIAAVGFYAGSLEIDSCNPSQPVSVLHIHGTGDQNIPIGGGSGPKSISGTSFNVPREGVETLARADGCPGVPAVDGRHEGDLTTTIWAPCRSGTEVELLTIDGANHPWPDGVQNALSKVRLGDAYQGFDATTQIWAFLASHPREPQADR